MSGNALLVGGVVDGVATDIRIRDGLIAELGHGLTPSADETEVEVRGAVLPGFRDAHTHLTWWAFERTRARLNGELFAATSAVEAADAVGRAAAAHDGGLLLGHGVQPSPWPDAPHRDLLDRAAPGVPVVLGTNDAHAGWWSTAALRMIGREHPTGFLREREWWEAKALLPSASDETTDRVVADAVAALAARGVTSVVDIDLEGGWAPWVRRAAAGPLSVRVWCDLVAGELDEAIADRRRTGDDGPRSNGMLRRGHLKLFTDGSLGGRTAYCDHAYDGDGDNRGQLLLEPDRLTALIARAHGAGIVATVHAIGDAANRIALDAFAAAGVGGRIEHSQLVAPGDIARFAALGVEVSIQPAHCPEDRDLSDVWWSSVADHVYPFRSLADAGVQMVTGSDAPVSEPDPLRVVQAAVTRTLDERPPWHPEQALRVDEVLAMTSAHRIEVGAPADLTFLEADPRVVPSRDIAAIPVLRTMVAGRWTYDAEV